MGVQFKKSPWADAVAYWKTTEDYQRYLRDCEKVYQEWLEMNYIYEYQSHGNGD